MSKVKQKVVPSFTAYVETEVEIDPDDLRKGGWHHESECSDAGFDENFELPDLTNDEIRGLSLAVASLHRQAHPGQSRSVRLCHEEPCRSLGLEHLRQVDA